MSKPKKAKVEAPCLLDWARTWGKGDDQIVGLVQNDAEGLRIELIKRHEGATVTVSMSFKEGTEEQSVRNDLAKLPEELVRGAMAEAAAKITGKG